MELPVIYLNSRDLFHLLSLGGLMDSEKKVDRQKEKGTWGTVLSGSEPKETGSMR